MTSYSEKLKAKCIRELEYSIDCLANSLKIYQYDGDIVNDVKWLHIDLVFKIAQVREMDTDDEVEAFCKKYFNELTYEKLIEEAKHE